MSSTSPGPGKSPPIRRRPQPVGVTRAASRRLKLAWLDWLLARAELREVRATAARLKAHIRLEVARKSAGVAAGAQVDDFRHHDARKPTCPSGAPLRGSAWHLKKQRGQE